MAAGRAAPTNLSQPLHSLFLSTSAPFLGSTSMLSFEGEDLDDYFHQPEKKRRLSANQVEFLEKSFEEENKLEPDRKTKLAKDLGLQPRQVAIWFQNRRARSKTKQMETDYQTLHHTYHTLKANYDNLLKEKDKLKAEVASLTEKVLAKGKQERPFLDSVSEVVGGCKQEDISSATSDIFDSHTPHSALLDYSSCHFGFPDEDHALWTWAY